MSSDSARHGCFFKIYNCVRAVDTSESERFFEFLQIHLLTVILGRPTEKAQEVDECFRQKSGITICGDTDYRAVAALGQLGPVRRYQQRQVRKLRRLSTCGFED